MDEPPTPLTINMSVTWEPSSRQVGISPRDLIAILQCVLSGGVFQNAFLVDRTVAALQARGHAVHTPRRIPANDGGLSFGQLVLASQSIGAA